MDNQRLYILGPCAAENREQVIETASQICHLSLPFGHWSMVFRAGVWKPRSRPGSFQGAGTEALKWLAEVKERLGVPVATEVATPEHAEAALKAGIDYLWIGARTSANPIAVQEIADAICHLSLSISHLKGILIKNPVNADAALWLGNIERLEKTGMPVIAVHRGCNHRPCWAMAHTLRTARPDIPMLLDPSHMSGDASRVPTLMEKISELGLDGAMVEVHVHPESALSDSKQQLTPDEIAHLSLPICHLKDHDTKGLELNWLRAEIDEVDDELVENLAARMDVSARIGAWKKTHNMAPLQPERFHQLLERLRATGERLGVRKEFIEQIWERIHEESLRKQE